MAWHQHVTIRRAMQPSPRPTLPVSPSQTLSTELNEPVGPLLAMVAGTPNGPHGLKLHIGEFQNPHVLHTQASPATSEQKLARVLQDVLGEEAPCHDLVAGTHADFAMRRYPCSMYSGAWQSTCTKTHFAERLQLQSHLCLADNHGRRTHPEPGVTPAPAGPAGQHHPGAFAVLHDT